MGMMNWTRRRFLGTAALAGGSTLLLGRPWQALGRTEDKMRGSDLLQQHFRIPLEAANQVVARMAGRGADLGELYFEDTVRTAIVWEDGRVRDVSYSEDSGVGLRAVKGETQAFGYTQVLETRELDRVADDVSSIANGSAAGQALACATPLRVRGDLYSSKDPSVRAAARGKIPLLARADKAARDFSPLIRRVEASLSEELRVVGLVNSEGTFFVDLLPMLSIRINVVAQKGSARQQGLVGGGGRMGLEYFEQTSPETLAQRAAQLAVGMLEARPAPAGPQTVVLAPGDSGVLLHEAVGHGLEADFNRKGTSKYSGKVGQMVASPLCTVVDDGPIPRIRGAVAFDDEGAAARRNVLIEKGKLTGYMHDWISARHFKLDVSGNGRRQSYRHPPLPRMTNTYMTAGEHDPQEILASTKKGIYCKTFSGGQVNIANGDFVFQVVESFLIEDGKLTAPLKDVVIIGNGPEALGRVTMVGNDLRLSDGRWTCGKEDQQVPVGVGIPTVKLEEITVGGTA
jgi:TldD protein